MTDLMDTYGCNCDFYVKAYERNGDWNQPQFHPWDINFTRKPWGSITQMKSHGDHGMRMADSWLNFKKKVVILIWVFP